MQKITIALIRFYQTAISSYLSRKFQCKFNPSCSQYAILAIEKFGLINGLIKAIARISKCHPFAKGGVDFP